MAGVNKAIILGRLGKDPEIRFAPSGMGVCNFSVATSERWKKKDGTTEERTEWHNVVVFDKLAENCAEYLKKGSQVYIECRIKTEKYDDKEGVTRYATKINAHTVQFLDGKKQEAQATSQAPDTGDSIPF